MAEALLSQMCGAAFEAESAGLEPGILNPLAVEALREIGIDIAGKVTRAIADVVQSGTRFDYVITVCDESSAARCPIFPGGTMRLHWSLPDPAKFQGGWKERLNPDSAIQMSDERTCNSEDTQPCSFKAFFALGRLLHWPMY